MAAQLEGFRVVATHNWVFNPTYDNPANWPYRRYPTCKYGHSLSCERLPSPMNSQVGSTSRASGSQCKDSCSEPKAESLGL